jgi:tetratricopeptide (TPR) repeat protein
VEAQIDAFSAEAERLRQPLFLWNAAIWRAMWALLCGRLDQAEELAQEALTIGSSGERVTAPLYNTLQLLAIRQEQERIEELEERARAAVQTGAQRPAWRASLATLLSASGRVSEARREVEALAAGGFAQIPRDGEWLGALALLADLCADLRLTAPAARLYELLLPYRESTVVVELAAVCLGSVARYLGRLATVLGRTEDAAGHLQRALECNATLAAPVLVAHTQLDYAELLGADDRSTELIDSAAQTAAGLGLARVARRAAHLRDAGAGDPGAAS